MKSETKSESHPELDRKLLNYTIKQIVGREAYVTDADKLSVGELLEKIEAIEPIWCNDEHEKLAEKRQWGLLDCPFREANAHCGHQGICMRIQHQEMKETGKRAFTPDNKNAIGYLHIAAELIHALGTDTREIIHALQSASHVLSIKDYYAELARRGYEGIDSTQAKGITKEKSVEGGDLVMKLKDKILKLLLSKLSAISLEEVEKREQSLTVVNDYTQNEYLSLLQTIE